MTSTICAPASPAGRPSTGTTRARPIGARRHARRSPTAPMRKPWVFRAKDLVGWWSNPHIERVGGLETAATAWSPRAKPIWLTEIGVPAVDKGANAPNVFPDPKSSELAIPPFSGGSARRPHPGPRPRSDPVPFRSRARGPFGRRKPDLAVYGGTMIDPEHVFVWAWDARPFPALPDFDRVWADGGELADRPLAHRPARGHRPSIASSTPCSPISACAPAALALDGFLDGYVIERPMSARAALEPLARLFGIDAVATAGALAFSGRGRTVRDRPRRRRPRHDRQRAGAAPRAGAGNRAARARSSSGSPTARRNIAGPPSHPAALPGQAGARRAPMPRSSPAAPRRSVSPMPGSRIFGPGARRRSSSSPGVISRSRQATCSSCRPRPVRGSTV